MRLFAHGPSQVWPISKLIAIEVPIYMIRFFPLLWFLPGLVQSRGSIPLTSGAPETEVSPPVSHADTIFHCETPIDCSLNGVCGATRKCSCDPAWTGRHCDVLNVAPTPKSSGYKNSTFASWGGNIIYDDEREEYHLFVAQFVNECPLGLWGSASSIVRATSSSFVGPFNYKETVINAFSHNPTIRKSPYDGRYYLFFIGSGDSTDPPDCRSTPSTLSSRSTSSSIHVSWSETLTGPWSDPSPVEFTDTSEYLCNGHTNPSPHFNPDGSVYLAFQAGSCHEQGHNTGALVGLARAESWDKPFALTSPDPVTPIDWDPIHPVCWAGVDEDPFLWLDERGFHILTHGMCPSGVRQAHYKFSQDGVNWKTSYRQTYHYAVEYDDSSIHAFARVERPQLLFSSYDEKTGYACDPIALVNGVCGLGAGHNRSDFECIFDQLTGMTYTLVRPLGE